MNETPDSTASVPVPPQPPAPRAAAFSLSLIAAVIAILAIVMAAWSWFDGRERIRDLKSELGRRLAESSQAANETRLLAKNADDAMRQVNERVVRIESEMATSQQQQLALETLYKDLAQGRDQWTLAEDRKSVV